MTITFQFFIVTYQVRDEFRQTLVRAESESDAMNRFYDHFAKGIVTACRPGGNMGRPKH
jgi:hypothetical protein